MAAAILVTGFLGAGKTTVLGRLRDALGPGTALVEARGCHDPAAETASPAPFAIIAVADAANVQACLDDPLVAPLVTAQLRAAGLVFLSRCDLAPVRPALQAVASVTAAPVLTAPDGALPPGTIERIRLLHAWTPAAPPVELAFAEWDYRGPAVLRQSAIDALFARRPPGLYRLSGEIRGRRGGVEVELAGRARQTRPIPEPPETRLVAAGPRARFRPDLMALAFSEAVAASAHLFGMFGHR